MRGENDELQVHIWMCGEVLQWPVKMAIVCARTGDDGDGPLHAFTAATAAAPLRICVVGWYSGTRCCTAATRCGRLRCSNADCRSSRPLASSSGSGTGLWTVRNVLPERFR